VAAGVVVAIPRTKVWLYFARDGGPVKRIPMVVVVVSVSRDDGGNGGHGRGCVISEIVPRWSTSPSAGTVDRLPRDKNIFFPYHFLFSTMYRYVSIATYSL
jgi:hypothetical protein